MFRDYIFTLFTVRTCELKLKWYQMYQADFCLKHLKLVFQDPGQGRPEEKVWVCRLRRLRRCRHGRHAAGALHRRDQVSTPC